LKTVWSRDGRIPRGIDCRYKRMYSLAGNPAPAADDEPPVMMSNTAMPRACRSTRRGMALSGIRSNLRRMEAELLRLPLGLDPWPVIAAPSDVSGSNCLAGDVRKVAKRSMKISNVSRIGRYIKLI
jgi:hypothetical protein